MKKPIDSITAFTTLDYPEHLACIVWFSGCNMRCPYCYNPDIVLGNGSVTEDELLRFLKTRQNRLDGVVLSGGECTLYKDIIPLCQKIKELGFDIKIDTNGSNPDAIKSLMQKNLVDFVALDFKASSQKYKLLTNTNLFKNFEKTLEILSASQTLFEVRTTVHTDLLNEEDINQMIEYLSKKGYKNSYFLQNFLNVETLGDVSESKRVLDATKLSDALKVELRNF